jgi:sugar fermentation stimulation protein A
LFAPPPGGAFVKMKFPELIPAKFLRRLNRFVGEVSIEGKRVFAHIRNTGRLTELLKPGQHGLFEGKELGEVSL